MHLSEYSFSNSLVTLKLKNEPTRLIPIVELLNKYTVSQIQFSKNWKLCYVIIKLPESKTTKGEFTYYIITEGGGGL